MVGELAIIVMVNNIPTQYLLVGTVIKITIKLPIKHSL